MQYQAKRHSSAQIAIVIVGDGGSYLPEEIHFTAASSVNWCASLYTAAINEDFTRVANFLHRYANIIHYKYRGTRLQ